MLGAKSWKSWVGMAALATVVAVGVSDRWMSRRALATGDPKTRQVRPPLTELQSGLQELTAVSRAFKSVARAAQPGVVHIRVTGGLRSSMSREDVKSYVRERLDDWLKAEGLDSRPAERTGGPRDAQRDREIREYLSDFVDAEQLAELDPRLLEKLYEKRAYLEKVADRAPSPPGSGSGLIFDAAGYVLTNNHVIEERSNITVVLHDERECPATLIGTDPKTDLAVLKIAATDLHPLPFGDSDTLEIGDWVLAVGSPFGLVQTVTHGIVSAKGRTHVPGIDIDYQDFIQTDASINPGNSGGPLLNLSGEVVGVNTAIATHGDGQSTGIAFTIPANRAARIADQLKLHGVVARGWLGVSFVELEPADRELLGLATARSVAVERVLCGSPAEQAGLMVEDVVVDLNGKPVAGSEQLRGMIADMGPQASVHVRVLRDGAERRIDLRLGSQPADLDAARHSRAVEARLVRPLGVWARTFRPGLVHQYNLPYDPSARGVLIWQLDQDWSGPREVKESELITACNGVPVRNVRDLCVALDGIAAGTRVKLEIRPPSGDPRLVTVKLPAGRQARTP